MVQYQLHVTVKHIKHVVDCNDVIFQQNAQLSIICSTSCQTYTIVATAESVLNTLCWSGACRLVGTNATSREVWLGLTPPPKTKNHRKRNQREISHEKSSFTQNPNRRGAMIHLQRELFGEEKCLTLSNSMSCSNPEMKRQVKHVSSGGLFIPSPIKDRCVGKC